MKYLILILVLITPPLFSTQEEVNIAINNAPPYRIVNNGTYSGIYIDIIYLVAKEMDIKLNFVEVPFQRALILIKNGSVDMMLGPNHNKTREKYMHYLIDSPMPEVNKVIYTNSADKKLTKYTDLYKYRVGVMRGAVYFSKFDNDNRINKVILVDYETAFRMLKLNRIDCVIIPEGAGSYIVNRDNLSFYKSPLIVPGYPSYVTLSKMSPWVERSDEIEKNLNKILTSKKIEEILNEYK